MTSPTPLPDWRSVGKEGTWTITDEYGESITIIGALLGLSSSFRTQHRNHPGKPFAPQRTHCSTCRWTEIRIFAVDEVKDGEAQGRYMVVKRGASAVPGEKDLIKWDWSITGHEVLETLTTRQGPEVFMTPTASRAVSQAAEFDGGMRDAWQNRAVK